MLRSFVAADAALQIKVVDHRLENGIGRQGAARIVEVNALGASGRFPADALNVKRCHDWLVL
jgi:hypothetical protein